MGFFEFVFTCLIFSYPRNVLENREFAIPGQIGICLFVAFSCILDHILKNYTHLIYPRILLVTVPVSTLLTLVYFFVVYLVR